MTYKMQHYFSAKNAYHKLKAMIGAKCSLLDKLTEHFMQIEENTVDQFSAPKEDNLETMIKKIFGKDNMNNLIGNGLEHHYTVLNNYMLVKKNIWQIFFLRNVPFVTYKFQSGIQAQLTIDSIRQKIIKDIEQKFIEHVSQYYRDSNELGDTLYSSDMKDYITEAYSNSTTVEEFGIDYIHRATIASIFKDTLGFIKFWDLVRENENQQDRDTFVCKYTNNGGVVLELTLANICDELIKYITITDLQKIHDFVLNVGYYNNLPTKHSPVRKHMKSINTYDTLLESLYKYIGNKNV